VERAPADLLRGLAHVPLDLAFWNRREPTTDAVDGTVGRLMRPPMETLEVLPRLMYW